MLVAVMIGLAQPVRLFLSRRRSIPRLRAARRWRMVLFTRNPPGDACLKGWVLFKHRRNTEGFRVSSKTTRRGQETSLIQGLADGRNGMRVVQLTSPETPGYQGFSPRPEPHL